MNIKTGQEVKVLTGKDRGKTGKVIQVFPKLNKVVVDGVNKTYKHLKTQKMAGGQKGERVEFFGPVHVSNVQVIASSAATKKTNSTEKTS